MKTQARGQTTFDISIRGDEVEQNRIQLEHNLQHTDLSFHLSSAPDDEYRDTNPYSVEYPRHNSGPSPFPDFASFEHRSRDHFDADTQSQLHAWSYRTVDEEEGINPYGGETMSTAAHHASALTLSAGLGGRGVRRDISLSGAEYDPDRPLHDMIAGVDSKLSVFDDPSKSRFMGAGSIAFDPLVVDSTAELDRILQSGHAHAIHSRSVRLRSPHSSASSSASDSGAPSTRPKLSDALRRVSFSPKRPRSAQSHHSSHSHSSDSHHKHSQLQDEQDHNNTDPRHIPSMSTSHSQRPPSSPLVAHHSIDYNASTAKVHTTSVKRNIFPSYTSSQPEVRLHPPTPSTTGSKLTKMARGLARDIGIEAEQSQWGVVSKAGGSKTTPDYTQGQERNPFNDFINTSVDPIRQPTPRRGAIKSHLGQVLHGNTSKGRVHLPDVTGLTSAVESPAKTGLKYYPYQADDGLRETEARLLSTLSTVQVKLHQLEEENSISRRRVRELELELEVCKREVARERSRVLEREEVIVQHQREMERAGTAAGKGKGKGKGRAIVGSDERSEANERYREVVEEKKALEALITSLRTHLTRLTSELSSHQLMLTELRTLRDSDVRALKEKGAEVDRLKEEVERLAGEIEVLRGVVEEGLKERRLVREQSEVRTHGSLLEAGEDCSHEDPQNGELGGRSEVESELHEEDIEEEEPEPMRSEDEHDFDPLSILGSSRANLPDRTMRTDHATLGSSNAVTSMPGRFVTSEEIEQISVDLEERRSERSASVLSSSQSHSRSRSNKDSRSQLQSRSPSPNASGQGERLLSQQDVSQPHDGQGSRGGSPVIRSSRFRVHQPSPSHQVAATPASATKNGGDHHDAGSSILETPFPQIRGGHLERLFFSAPEHNARTCTVCHRRRRPGSPQQQHSPSWLPSHRAREFRPQVEGADDNDDEGFVEGLEEMERDEHVLRDAQGKGKQREYVDFSNRSGPRRKGVRGESERGTLPPQTVLARIVRELEDDFTHYKSIYVELADQYKEMDAISNVPKRNILAQHLREVVDILEQKGDHIAGLYDLLTFKDKHVSESIVPPKPSLRTNPHATSSLGRNESPRRRMVA